MLENYKAETQTNSLLEFLSIKVHLLQNTEMEKQIFQVEQTSHEPDKDVLSEK